MALLPSKVASNGHWRSSSRAILIAASSGFWRALLDTIRVYYTDSGMDPDLAPVRTRSYVALRLPMVDSHRRHRTRPSLHDGLVALGGRSLAPLYLSRMGSCRGSTERRWSAWLAHRMHPVAYKYLSSWIDDSPARHTDRVVWTAILRLYRRASLARRPFTSSVLIHRPLDIPPPLLRRWPSRDHRDSRTTSQGHSIEQLDSEDSLSIRIWRTRPLAAPPQPTAQYRTT